MSYTGYYTMSQVRWHPPFQTDARQKRLVAAECVSSSSLSEERYGQLAIRTRPVADGAHSPDESGFGWVPD
jgi:hypothetical protein